MFKWGYIFHLIWLNDILNSFKTHHAACCGYRVADASVHGSENEHVQLTSQASMLCHRLKTELRDVFNSWLKNDMQKEAKRGSTFARPA